MQVQTLEINKTQSLFRSLADRKVTSIDAKTGPPKKIGCIAAYEYFTIQKLLTYFRDYLWDSILTWRAVLYLPCLEYQDYSVLSRRLFLKSDRTTEGH